MCFIILFNAVTSSIGEDKDPSTSDIDLKEKCMEFIQKATEKASDVCFRPFFN